MRICVVNEIIYAFVPFARNRSAAWKFCAYARNIGVFSKESAVWISIEDTNGFRV